MDINEFVSLQLAQPRNRVPAYLIIPGYLQSAIKATKAKSEAKVLEMGNCLNWDPALGRLSLAGQPIVGEFNWLDLKLPIAKHTTAFIGTYHNHPYEKRYGADYALGPSSGDWIGWNDHFPGNYGVSVNIVTSGKLVFVAFLLQRSPGRPDCEYGDTDDFSPLLFQHIYSDDHLNDVYSDAIHKKVWSSEKEMYQNLLGQADLRRTHQEDVMRMNTSYASRNPGFVLYIGTLADSVCKVEIYARHVGLSFLDNIQSADRTVCYSCGQRRTHDNPSYFSQWHRCPSCKAVFCPQHGKILPGNHFYSRSRNCVVCNSRTLLF